MTLITRSRAPTVGRSGHERRASMSEITDTLERFIVTEVAAGRGVRSIPPEEDLIGSGIIDSLGIQDLVAFVEDRYRITVEPRDVLPANFQSLSSLEAFIASRLADRHSAA
jgi:acyl carrier protein